MRRFTWYPFVLVLLVAACGDVSLGEMKSALRTHLAVTADSTLTAYYDARDFNPRWTQRDHLNGDADTLVHRLCRADALALNPERYALPRLADLYEQGYAQQDNTPDSVRARALAEIEATLTQALLAYARDLHTGSARPADTTARRWTAADSARVLEGQTLAALRQTLAPPQQNHAAYARELASYRALDASGGWPTVTNLLQPGAAGPDVASLRTRLALTGDLDEPGDGPYDEPVSQAVGRFQQRHGLPPSGLVDESTRQALNVPAATRLRQVEVGLERRRWLPAQLADAYLIANLADGYLYGFRDGEEVLSVETTIRSGCTLPAFAADSIAAVAFSTQRARLLHTGAAQQTFEALSLPDEDTDACFRVQNPAALAAFVLEGTGRWDAGQVQEALGAGVPRTVPLAAPMPLYILPLSAWLDAEGKVQFRNQTPADRALARALAPDDPQRVAQACQVLTRAR